MVQMAQRIKGRNRTHVPLALMGNCMTHQRTPKHKLHNTHHTTLHTTHTHQNISHTLTHGGVHNRGQPLLRKELCHVVKSPGPDFISTQGLQSSDGATQANDDAPAGFHTESGCVGESGVSCKSEYELKVNNVSTARLKKTTKSLGTPRTITFEQ